MSYFQLPHNSILRAIPQLAAPNRFAGASPIIRPSYVQQSNIFPQGLNNFGNYGPFGNPLLTSALLFGGGFFGGIPFGGLGYGVYNPYDCNNINNCPPPDMGAGAVAVNGGFDPSFAIGNPATW